jgi:hypothetical protein
MTKNTFKPLTTEDLKQGIKTLKVDTIKKYKEKHTTAKKKYLEIRRERETSRNVMHDVGLENKMSIELAEMKTIEWCIKTLNEQK